MSKIKKVVENADYIFNVDSDTGHRRSWGDFALTVGGVIAGLAALAAAVAHFAG